MNTSQTLMNTPQKPRFSVEPVKDLALEAGLLSRLINERYAAVQVLHLLSDNCFYDNDHLQLFRAIRQLDVEGHEIDMLSVVDKLHDTLSPEQAQELVSRTSATIFGNTEYLELDHMALRLQEYARRRAVGQICEKLMRLHSDMTYPLEESIREVKELFDQTMMGSTDSIITLSQKLQDLIQVIEDNQDDATRHQGLLCELPQIDAQGGLPSDGLVVIGAKPSHGKTTFATNVAINALKHGHHVAFYSMKMSAEKVTSRILAMECGFSSNTLQRLRLTSYERSHALTTITQLQQTVADHFYFDNRNIRDIDALTMSIRALKKQHEVDCIVVDYIQLMDAPPGQKTDTTNKTLGQIAHKLHDLAKDLHVCILALSQINRAIQGEPNMSHLRDSGEIAEAADMVIILFNADFEHTTFPKPFANIDPKGKLQVRLEKNRDGATDAFIVGFSSSETRIYALTESPSDSTLEPVMFSYEDS